MGPKEGQETGYHYDERKDGPTHNAAANINQNGGYGQKQGERRGNTRG
jgi:hypothetical protein